MAPIYDIRRLNDLELVHIKSFEKLNLYICFCFFPLCLFWTWIFLAKKLVLFNLNAIFPWRKCSVTSAIKIYSKMRELCMHPDYDHLYIPLTSKKGKFQPQTFFLGITTLFLLSLLLCSSRFLNKNHEFFQFKIPLWQASK